MSLILKLITFDVTGTILRLKVPVGDQYAKVGSYYGVHNIHPDKLSNNFKCIYKNMIVEHPNFGVNDIGWETWWMRLVHHTFFSSLPKGKVIESVTMDKIASDLIDMYNTKECWELTEGAQCLLDKLSSKNIMLGVISNYDPRLDNILKELNVYSYFKFVITSYSVNCEKPNPEIFKIVEEINKDVKKEEILHIGDNLKFDFIGAKNVGWNAILIGGNTDHNYSEIDKKWIVNNLGEIYETLHHKKLL